MIGRALGRRPDDGEQAVATLRACTNGEAYDLVLMDIEMPVMSGIEATRRIRAMGRDPERLPIVAITGHADPTHIGECLDSGMNDTAVKPVDSATLARLVRKWVPEARAG